MALRIDVIVGVASLVLSPLFEPRRCFNLMNAVRCLGVSLLNSSLLYHRPSTFLPSTTSDSTLLLFQVFFPLVFASAFVTAATL